MSSSFTVVREFIGGTPVLEFRCGGCMVRPARFVHHPDSPDDESLSPALCADCAERGGVDFLEVHP